MNPWKQAARNLLAQPAFVVVAVLLGVSAITLNSAVGYLKLHFKKLAVPLAVHSLKEGLPEQFGDHWIQISHDQPLDPSTEEVLATHEYVFRDYADRRLISADEVEQLRQASGNEYAQLMGDHERRHPQAIIRAAVTYYTGMVDTVAHVPERCYVADGYESKGYDDYSKTIGNYPDGHPRDLSFRFISFEDQTGSQRVSRNVGYLFHVNGEYKCDSLAVRAKLQDLTESYGYYAKVELMTQMPRLIDSDNIVRDQSINAMTDFLGAALPEIEKCLPDWKALHEKKPESKVH
ncbi:MAG TPA: hypothetical protein VH370_22185 [Humisphaera sp.]|nr:hypothetical protein [Humisphaera sp.]